MRSSTFNKTVFQLIIFLTVSLLFLEGCGKKESSEVSKDSGKSKTSTENTEMKHKDGMTDKSKTSTENTEMKHKDGMTDKSNSDHIMVNLPTMQCSTCKKNIETAVKKLDGIESINVVVKEKVAHINYDKSKTDLTKIENTITAAGYDANDKKADPEAYKELDDCCKLPQDQKEKSGH